MASQKYDDPFYDIFTLRFSYNFCRKGEDYKKLDMVIFFQSDPKKVIIRTFRLDFKIDYQMFMSSYTKIANYKTFIKETFTTAGRHTPLEFKGATTIWDKTV